MTEDGAINLSVAIIDQARKDYISMGLGKAVAGETIGSLEKWLKSPHGSMFRGGAGAETVIENWKRQTAYQKWRVETGCLKCKKKAHQCIHRAGEGDYTKARVCRLEVAK